jgi:hypothetical protein
MVIRKGKDKGSKGKGKGSKAYIAVYVYLQ